MCVFAAEKQETQQHQLVRSHSSARTDTDKESCIQPQRAIQLFTVRWLHIYTQFMQRNL